MSLLFTYMALRPVAASLLAPFPLTLWVQVFGRCGPQKLRSGIPTFAVVLFFASTETIRHALSSSDITVLDSLSDLFVANKKSVLFTKSSWSFSAFRFALESDMT